MFDIDDPKLAAVAWSRITEPGDAVAGALVNNLGACEALRWLLQTASATQLEPETLFTHDPILMVSTGDTGDIFSLTKDFEPANQKVKPEPRGVSAADPEVLTRLKSSAEGWRVRLADLDPMADIKNGERVGAHLILPGDPHWPIQFADLGDAAPFVLWVKGDIEFAMFAGRSVALVGSRASTHYGEQVAVQMAAGLTERSFAVISGGAYGIDAAAHRGTLTSEGFTVAFLAGGIDRPYPPGNTGLLRAIADTGAVVSEVPPGSTPYRNRFLARNRLIAALAGATVVVEAAWRSGALSTARHASSLLRPVGAVPGPVTSMASGGCHQLIRSGEAVLVTDAGEVAELAGNFAHDAAAIPVGRTEESDGLTADQKQVYGILPIGKHLDVAALTRNAGLPLPTVLAALGILEIRGLAQSKNNAWRRGKVTKV